MKLFFFFSMCTVCIVLCDVGGHTIIQIETYWIIKSLSYDNISVIDWLKFTNPVINWVAYSLELTVGNNLHTVIALPINSVANVTLSNLKQVLVEVNYGSPGWFSLLHPHSLLDSKGVLAALGRGNSIKVPGSDPLSW